MSGGRKINIGDHFEYIPMIYTFVKRIHMKVLSLKLEDKIFEEAEVVSSKLKLARNRYINEAVNLYNKYHMRKLLKKKLAYESGLSSKDSMEILHEFESLIDED